MRFLLLVFVGLLWGCTSPQPATQATAIMETNVDLFVVETGVSGRRALALPDSEFFVRKTYNGAPSIEHWKQAPERYPHVVGAIRQGASMRFERSVTKRGFSFGYGFGSRTDVMVRIEGWVSDPLVAHDILSFSDEGNVIGFNPRYVRSMAESKTSYLDL